MSQDMAVFVEVAERGSFTAAADKIGLTPSAVSKLVARLEERLGARLLHRTTRRIALTPAGEVYLARSRQILDDIEDVETEIRARGNDPRGPLRINTGVAFATHQLMPALPEFMLRYPLIEPHIAVTDHVVDLLRTNTDVAIRTGRVVDTALVMRKICDLRRLICASPEYLKRHGTPKKPSDLYGHECITIADIRSLALWPFAIDGTLHTIEAKSRVRVDNAEALLQLGLAGAGIFRSADNLCGESIRRGRLVSLLTDSHVDEPVPLTAVYPQGRHRSPAVRAFIDFVVEKFGHAPWQCEADG